MDAQKVGSTNHRRPDRQWKAERKKEKEKPPSNGRGSAGTVIDLSQVFGS